MSVTGGAALARRREREWRAKMEHRLWRLHLRRDTKTEAILADQADKVRLRKVEMEKRDAERMRPSSW